MLTEQCWGMLSSWWPFLFDCKFQFPDKSCFAASLVQMYSRKPGQAESLQIQENINHLVVVLVLSLTHFFLSETRL